MHAYVPPCLPLAYSFPEAVILLINTVLGGNHRIDSMPTVSSRATVKDRLLFLTSASDLHFQPQAKHSRPHPVGANEELSVLRMSTQSLKLILKPS